MTGATSYVAMLCLAGFFGATWIASKVGQISGASTVLLEVATGVILGPKVLKLVHPEYSVCAASRFINCELPEDFDDLVDDGASFGTSLDKIAEMDYCPTDLYFDEEDDDEDEDEEDDDHEDEDDEDEDDEDDEDEDDEDDDEEEDDRRRSALKKGSAPKSKTGKQRRLAKRVKAASKARRLTKGNSTTVVKVRAAGVKGKKHPVSKKHRASKKTRVSKKSRRSTKKGRSLKRRGLAKKSRGLAKRSNHTVTTKSHRGHRLARKVKGRRYVRKVKRSGHKLHRTRKHKKLTRTATAKLLHVNSTGRKLRQSVKRRDDDDDEEEDEDEDDEEEEDEDEEDDEEDDEDEDEDDEDEDEEDEEEPEFESYGECLQASCEAYVAERCQYAPDILTLVGQWGVALMFFDRGLQFTPNKLKGGTRGGLMSFTGVVLALITGSALAVIYGYPLFPDGAAMGVILVPTSFTVALNLLSRAGLQNEPIVKTLVSASFVDDFLSLLLFHILFSLRTDEFDGIETILFPAICILLVIIGGALAVKFWPRVLQDNVISEYIKDKRADEALLFIMITMLALWSLTTHFLGSHLWGCFIAGMGFACLAPEELGRNLWTERTSALTSWMTRLLFASAVGFSFPVEEFFSAEAFWKGIIMGFGPCILFKAISGLFIKDARLIASIALVSRAEFAFLIAQMSNAAELIDDDLYAIALWALGWANLATPFIFQSAVKAYVQKSAHETAWLDVQPREAISMGSVATDGIDLEDSSVVEGKAVAAEPKRRWGPGGRLCCLW